MANQMEDKKVLSGSPRITKVSFLGRVSAVIRQHFQQAFSSFSELWKTPFATLMTIFVLGLALSLPSAFHVLYKNAERVTGQWDGASEISLFLKKDISEPRVQVLINKLALYNDIDSVTYISRHQALEEFKEMSSFSKALNYLDENPLPAVLVVVPTKEAMNSAGSKLLVAKLEREQGIDLVRVDVDWIEKLQAILSLLVDIVIAIAVLLLISVLLIVSNTIRLNILSQRDEIEVLKLVGATNSFIQRPYLYVGAWYGLLGGVIAWLLTFAMVTWLQSGVMSLMGLYQLQFEISLMSFNEVMTLFGVATGLGFVASYVSVKQYLVKIEPK
ncbi:permease-like cell division protein FtsX [Psychromonas sp. Urea-02u-13]|uniref:permease-like cell division protein FtsX n=1 Tax=Psychromonas sp. Urea-02u-13 TaxID=2058326 RepID=UPI000C32EC17|nr:permease-like cell division protein FtsX [Psychromonas sp. Urea-02u-13]PKG39448.1 cell division protein FtsX [Psychromonas sp. Urea-02u-13]